MHKKIFLFGIETLFEVLLQESSEGIGGHFHTLQERSRAYHAAHYQWSRPKIFIRRHHLIVVWPQWDGCLHLKPNLGFAINPLTLLYNDQPIKSCSTMINPSRVALQWPTHQELLCNDKPIKSWSTMINPSRVALQWSENRNDLTSSFSGGGRTSNFLMSRQYLQHSAHRCRVSTCSTRHTVVASVPAALSTPWSRQYLQHSAHLGRVSTCSTRHTVVASVPAALGTPLFSNVFDSSVVENRWNLLP